MYIYVVWDRLNHDTEWSPVLAFRTEAEAKASLKGRIWGVSHYRITRLYLANSMRTADEE